MELVLASTSPYRRELLARLCLPFRWRAPAVDEESLKQPGIKPRALAERLALAKASSLASLEAAATLIGSDQLAVCDGRILGKPGGPDRALAQLEQLSGRWHELITAVAVLHDGRLVMHTDVTRLLMRSLSRGELERYVVADRPFDCAGSYKIESRGIALFEQIDSEDHTAITGLPLIALATILRDLGYKIP